MEILSVYSAEFKRYGKVLDEFPTAELVEAMSKTPVTDHVEYVPVDENIQKLPITEVVSRNLYGGMPVEMGWCNGHNTKMNCLEYHRDSEFNMGATEYILLVARIDDIEDGKLDSSKVKAFKAPAGVMIETYATTLHFAPCHVHEETGFQVLIVLPYGTNFDKPEIERLTWEDDLLFAQNKWLIAHADAAEAQQGAYVGITGENVDISDLLKEIE
ncbi:MAG: DUF4867 family protein [Oscillospiraceae bacterium]|nr:DUF4867 family protein [Oscillospiraceae bacterium]MBR2805531.1 DUF4867 family protein [Oscillospiraceae bacterium]